MKKLLYAESKVRMVINRAGVMAKESGKNINYDFIYYHNHICPTCRNELKVDKHSNEVKNVGAVILSVFEQMNLIVPFVICKPCSKRTPIQQKAGAQASEDYILNQLGLRDNLLN